MTKVFDRATFFTYVRRAPFGNRLSQSQVDGLEAIMDYWEEKFYEQDIRFLAYIYATVFHETGGEMSPVREGFAKTDEAARKIVAKRKYGIIDPKTNHVYYGRGLVQLTWLTNYEKMGKLLGLDLINNPDLVLDEKIGIAILFEGMMNGLSGDGDFTGKSLEDYFNASKDDPVGARAIINGRDKAALIASYHELFLISLKEAMKAAATGTRPADVTKDTATPDGANLFADKTIWGGIATGAGGIGASLFGAINNPWALGAFAFIAIIIIVGVFLVVTGRIEIKRKAGA